MHAHFPEQNLSIMVEERYHPNIMENVINERTDKDTITEYFECIDQECPKKGETHTHLLHMDPHELEYTIPPKQYKKMNHYKNDDYKWSD